VLAHLADQLGTVEAVSDFVCNAAVLRDYPENFDVLVDNLVAFNMVQRRLGNVRPELLAMTDQQFENRTKLTAADYFSTEIVDTELSLRISLREIEKADATTAHDLLAALGIKLADEGFHRVETVASLAAAIEHTSKLMHPGCREFVALNPVLASPVDPLIADELAGREAEDPVIRQRYRELRHEL